MTCTIARPTCNAKQSSSHIIRTKRMQLWYCICVYASAHFCQVLVICCHRCIALCVALFVKAHLAYKRMLFDCAGALRRSDPDGAEDELLLRTMQDLISPKLVYQDRPLFQALFSDLFPTTQAAAAPNAELREALHAVMQEHNLQVMRLVNNQALGFIANLQSHAMCQSGDAIMMWVNPLLQVIY